MGVVARVREAHEARVVERMERPRPGFEAALAAAHASGLRGREAVEFAKAHAGA